MHLGSIGLTFLVGCRPDGRVKCTVGLHKSPTQEPVIVFFPCLSYPNGDRLRQAMPEGYQSLSALPGKGLLVGMGLERSLRFPPAWPSAKSELVWTRAPNNDVSPESPKANHFPPSAPLFLTAGAVWMRDRSKRRHFRFKLPYLGGFERPVAPVEGWLI